MRALWRRFACRFLADEQAHILIIILVVALVAILGFGHMLMPLFAAMVLAFMLEGGIKVLMHWGLRRFPAVLLVFFLFFGVTVTALLLLVPMLWDEAVSLTVSLPLMLRHSQMTLLRLPHMYPHLVSNRDVENWMHVIQGQLGQLGQWLLALSPDILGHLMTLGIYMVLIPSLVFMLLKDREMIHAWWLEHLPMHRPALSRLAEVIQRQLYRYIRGRVLEVLLIALSTYLMFWVQDLSYALLLAILVGLSVIIPYLGAIMVTVPVMVVAFVEWNGITPHFWRILGFHAVIQLIDGNLLVPLLFAEAVDLHPIAIVVAIIVFGGLWGVWGVFFAIPLAVVLRCLVVYWPINQNCD